MMKIVSFITITLLAVGCAQSTKKTDAAKDAKATNAKEAGKTAAKGAATATGAIECKSGTDVRNLELKTASAGGYEVVYTKFGEAKSIATGGKEHCEAILNRVKGNLANAGFTCN